MHSSILKEHCRKKAGKRNNYAFQHWNFKKPESELHIFSVESTAKVPHLKHLFYLDRKQAGGSSLLFLIETPPFVDWRAVQHTQAVLGNKVHAVPGIWIILCHLMEVFLQQTNVHKLGTL